MNHLDRFLGEARAADGSEGGRRELVSLGIETVSVGRGNASAFAAPTDNQGNAPYA